MKPLAWTLQVLLALVFAGVGTMKLTSTPASLDANPRMRWTQDFSPGQVRAIGAAEVAGAVGLVVPAATGIAPVLTPVAAGALSVLMGGAVVTHVRRGEPPIGPAILGVLALGVAVLRRRLAVARA